LLLLRRDSSWQIKEMFGILQQGMPMMFLANHKTPKELAALLKERTGTGTERMLRMWRQRRIGPPWVKIGHNIILYPDDAFELWLRSQLQQPVRSRRERAVA
jgi:hypothetical protein